MGATDVIGHLWANRTDVSTSLLHLFNENPDGFISRFLAVDESWIHHFNPESKVQRMAWKHASSPPPRKFRVVASARKVLSVYLSIYLSFGQGSSLLWTHTLRPFIAGPLR